MDSPLDPYSDDLVPVEADDAAPRRAASAEFVVDGDVGSQALMREAMDPANQSLGEALRLSYRVLQVVILVLIILFVFSGFHTVTDGQSGVLLRWGKIVEVNGSPALTPGLKFSKWPYPAGEFVLFSDRDRDVNLRGTFWPMIRAGDDFDKAVERASEHDQYRPGRDGLVLTQGGDIAHIQVSASYDVDIPERFVHAVENADPDPRNLDADRLVELALERAIVHVAASRPLKDFVDFAAKAQDDARIVTQELLDTVDSGIQIVAIETPKGKATPPFTIQKAIGEYDAAGESSGTLIKAAEDDASKARVDAAGADHADVLTLIGMYEDAYEAGDETAAEAALLEINAWLESDEASGDVTSILGIAKSYRSTIQQTLGREAERFASYLPTYRAHPDLVIQRLWMETYGRVLSRKDVEIFFAPEDGSVLKVSMAGLDHIRELRRKNMLLRQQEETYLGSVSQDPYIRRGRDRREGPGRQLSREGESLNKDN